MSWEKHFLKVIGSIYSKPKEDDKPFIVSVRSEDDIVRSNNRSANIALAFAILLAVAGILIMVFMR